MLSADVRNLTETDTAADISTSGTLTISDVDSPATFVAQAGTVGSYGTFAIDAPAPGPTPPARQHNEFVAGTTYTDTFAVASADGTLTSVTINILGTNDTPVANGDAATVAEGGAVTTVNVLANDSDADSALTAASITAFTQGGNGSVVYNNDGTFTYTHNGSETTSDSFTYTIDDGAGGTATTAVSLTVNAPVNQAPVSVDDSGFSTSQDTALTIASSMLLANDSDPNGDPLAITEVSGATNGTVAFDSQTNVITFTPNANYTGTANFSYTVSDGTGGTATASVGLTVTPPTTSLFSSSDTPAALSSLDASEVNLGVRFEASTVGAIWGVKYSGRRRYRHSALDSTAFAIDAAGAWTYTASSAHNEFAAGDHLHRHASRSPAPTAPSPRSPSTSSAPTTPRLLSADVRDLTRDQRGGRHFHLRHADHQRRRQPGHLRGAGRHRRQLRHLRHRRAPAPGPTPPARRTTSSSPAPPTPTPSRSPAPTAPHARSPSTSSAPTTPRLLSADVRDLTETNAAADICHLRHADHQRRRQPGHLRGAGRHRRQLRHLRHRRRRRLDLHRQLGAQRVRRRHHLHRHLLGRQRRRHPDLGHRQHPRHQRRRGVCRPTSAT